MVTSLDEESLEALIVAGMTVNGPSGGWVEAKRTPSTVRMPSTSCS